MTSSSRSQAPKNLKIETAKALKLEKEFDNFDDLISSIKAKTIIDKYTKPLTGIGKGLAKFYESQLLFESNFIQHSIFLATFWGLLQKLVFEFKDYNFASQITPFKKLFLRAKYASDISKANDILREFTKGIMEIVKKMKEADIKEQERNTKLYQIINSKELEV
jgi:hypothetical protein